MGALTVLVTVAAAVAVLAVLMLVAWCLLRANRLDRLHVRTDAARAALVAALERRAVVARSIAASTGDEELRRTAVEAEQAPDTDRESQENDLGRRLAELDRAALAPELLTELADAEQRVMLARRVHNDAVRDTLVLRSRRLVRWLRLAGTAPAPGYLDIADVPPEGDPTTVAPPRPRRAARVLLVDPDGRLLLFEGFDPARPQESYWFTPGGGLRAGEDARAAAARELAEETGLRLPAERLVGPVWQRRSVFSFDGGSVAADEEFFLASADGGPVDTAGFTELERATVLRYRWWSPDELRATDAVVYPRRLGTLLAQAWPGEWDGVTRPIS